MIEIYLQHFSPIYLFLKLWEDCKFTTVIEAKMGILALLVYFWPIAFLSMHEDFHVETYKSARLVKI